MNFDYLLISGRTDGPTSLYDYDISDVIKPIGKTDAFTFNDRQIGFAISGADAPTKNIEVTALDSGIFSSKVSAQGNKDSTLKAYWSRVNLKIVEAEEFDIISNPLKANMIIADTRCIEPMGGQKYNFTTDTLLMVEVDDIDFLPTRTFGEATARVTDTWRRNKITGFAVAIDSATKPKLVIEGRDNNSGKFLQLKLEYTGPDLTPELTLHTVTAEKSRPAWKKMEASGKFRPQIPRKGGVAPTTIVLTTLDEETIKKAVRDGLDNYPHLKPYGKKINIYRVDNLRDNELTKAFVKPGTGKKGKQVPRTSTKGEYLSMNDISIVILNRETISFTDENYVTDLTYFWNEGIIWRFPGNTVRTLTIVKDDIIPLSSIFRKEVKLRYIEMLDPANGGMSAFITNRF